MNLLYCSDITDIKTQLNSAYYPVPRYLSGFFKANKMRQKTKPVKDRKLCILTKDIVKEIILG